MHHLPSIYFLHIPKSAGSSFRSWLEDLFAIDGRLPADHLPELEAATANGLPAYQFYSGHFGWRLMELAEGSLLPVSAVTILREPLSLYSSGWTFASAIAEEDAQKLGPNRQRDISAAAVASAPAPDSSVAPAAPTGYEEPEPQGVQGEQDEFQYSAFQNMVVRNFAHYGTEVETPVRIELNHYELALQRLKSLPFFGLSEDWQRSAVLFADAFHLPLRLMDRSENAQDSARRKELPAEFVRDTQAFNQLDFALYEEASKLFKERFAAAAKKFGLPSNAPAEAFRQALKQQCIAAGNQLAASERLRMGSIAITAGLLNEGFNHRLFDEQQGWKLWSGPELYSCVYLPVERSVARTAKFNLDSVQAETILNDMQVFVDGQPAESKLRYVKQADGGFTIFKTVTLPARANADDKSYTEIGFLVTEARKARNPVFRSKISYALIGNIQIAPTAPHVSDSAAIVESRIRKYLRRFKFW